MFLCKCNVKIAAEGLNFESIIWGLIGEVNAIVFGRWDRLWVTYKE